MSTQIVEELNILIGSDFIPLKLMIQFAVKVAVVVIPESLANIDEQKQSPTEVFVKYKEKDQEKYLRQQISKNEFLNKILQGLEDISPTTTFNYTLDFESYNFLYEMLVLSVKLSFAGDEIKEKEECERIINELWSLMCHKHTTYKLYSFLLFVKYKLHSKVSRIRKNLSYTVD